MLTTISNRIRKHKKESSEATAFRRSSLLRALSLSYSLVMLSYYNYTIQNISSYRISKSDSSHCKTYVFINRTGYNILKMTEKQLINFAIQYTRLKDEVQRATEKLLRLQNQKKMWFEKMMCAVQ